MNLCRPDLKAGRKRYSTELQVRKIDDEESLRLMQRSVWSRGYGIGRQGPFPTAKSLNDSEQNPSRLFLESVVNAIAAPLPSDAALGPNIRLIERYANVRANNFVREEFDPVMRKSKTTVRAVPMAI